ncbi:hypothetical protein [Deinococcus roseus]|nr:hypothetical protein [Deinococcus roseus]
MTEKTPDEPGCRPLSQTFKPHLWGHGSFWHHHARFKRDILLVFFNFPSKASPGSLVVSGLCAGLVSKHLSPNLKTCGAG